MKILTFNFKLLIPRDATVTECPKCKTPGALDRRKSTDWKDRILQKITLRKSFHCSNCKWDGKIFIFRITRKYSQVLLSYLVVTVSFLLVLLALYILTRKGKLG